MKSKILLAALAAMLLAGCATHQDTAKTRHEAADDTAKLKEEGKKAGIELRKGAEEARRQGTAIAEGVREGWNSADKVDINSASKAQLMSLPGMDDDSARRIITGRPYHTRDELETRSVVSEDLYAKIKDKVLVK
jgi:DNA uptake protein ComE-like DNA-binding protein